MAKLTAQMILDNEQRERAFRRSTFTGLTPQDAHFHPLVECLLEDLEYLPITNVDCEEVLVATWQPAVSLETWFQAAKKAIKEANT